MTKNIIRFVTSIQIFQNGLSKYRCLIRFDNSVIADTSYQLRNANTCVAVLNDNGVFM